MEHNERNISAHLSANLISPNKGLDNHSDASSDNRVYSFTSEAVSEGHPDKVADQISDAVLDEALSADPNSRVACEVLVANDYCVIAGEVTTNANLDYETIARRAIIDAGYDGTDGGFNGHNCEVVIKVSEQSQEIAQGVSEYSKSDLNKLGAGDQGIIFGYATNETAEYLPLSYVLAQSLVQKLAEVRKSRVISYLRSDSKAQVTVEYINGQPVSVKKVLISTQHLQQADGSLPSTLEHDLLEHVIKPAFGAWYDDDISILINPAGAWSVGGPTADTGLTGRKIIVDTYGGGGRHGGGAFSGKDATKVDRSGAYAARYVAKNIVAAGLASRCEVQISYAIGRAKPFSFQVETFGTETVAVDIIEKAASRVFDLRPAAIIQDFELTLPRYKSVSCYGHFGRLELYLPWEEINKDVRLNIAVAELLKEERDNQAAKKHIGSPATCEHCEALIKPLANHPPFGTKRDNQGRTHISHHVLAAAAHGLNIEEYLDVITKARIDRYGTSEWITGHSENIEVKIGGNR